jgi:hypothetical protein
VLPAAFAHTRHVYLCSLALDKQVRLLAADSGHFSMIRYGIASASSAI